MCFRRLPFQPPMKRREHSRFKRQMVHGAYDPLKLKDCTTKVENGQEKLLMYKKCFFMIGRYWSWVVCYTYATWFSLGGLARTGKTYENYLVMREGVDFLRETKQQWRLGRKVFVLLWKVNVCSIISGLGYAGIYRIRRKIKPGPNICYISHFSTFSLKRYIVFK